MQPIDSFDLAGRVACRLLIRPHRMPVSAFPDLLTRHMRRIRASAAGVASEIGISREAVNNWRHGYSLPNRKHRDKVLACANYLRLTEAEANALLAAAGFEPEYPGEAQAADAAEAVPAAAATSPAVAEAIDGLFARLQRQRPYPVLLLLTQAHWGQPPERAAILAQAQARYGRERVLHLQPPFSAGEDADAYFAALGRQCGMEAVASDYDFENALAGLLRSPAPLFCLVSRFEQGTPAQRNLLAGILRSLSEMHSGQLHLLLCGGAALADLKYQGGDLSLLNIAATESWPELQAADLQRVAGEYAPSAQLAARALRLSGGHPPLARAAIALLAQHDLADAAVIEYLAGHAPLWQALLPLLQDPTQRAIVQDWLAQPRLSPARPYLLDPVLRHLYWSNLLVARAHPDGNWLEWRCEAIRRAAALIVEQLDGGAA